MSSLHTFQNIKTIYIWARRLKHFSVEREDANADFGNGSESSAKRWFDNENYLGTSTFPQKRKKVNHDCAP